MVLGALIVLLGAGVVVGAFLLSSTSPPQDANIGAGLLLLVGAGIVIAGIAVIVTCSGERRRGNRRGG
jgi:drug/metabolite transporter (DMT)-like permease